MANRKGNYSGRTMQLLSILNHPSASASITVLSDATKIKRVTVYQTLHRLKVRGLVECWPSKRKWGGNVWLLTEAGRKVAAGLGSEP